MASNRKNDADHNRMHRQKSAADRSYNRQNVQNDSRVKAKEPKKQALGIKLKLILAFSVIALLFAVFAIVNISIGVREIDVNGIRLCTREEILSVAGIEEGSGYFSYNTSSSEKKIKEIYPCVSEIRISRSVFGKVTVSVTEESALWYIESYDEYFALSEDLRVIKSEDVRSRFIELGLVRLDFPEVRSAVLGKPIEIRDDDRDCSYVSSLLEDITGTNIYRSGRLDQIKIKNKFEVFLVVDCRHLVSVGNCSEISDKLAQVEKMLDDDRFDWSKKTEIIVSDPSSPSARENPELDFSYLVGTNAAQN